MDKMMVEENELDYLKRSEVGLISTDEEDNNNSMENSNSIEENFNNEIERILIEIYNKNISLISSGNSSDITMRAKEAMAYGKRLITDCRSDLEPCFHEGQLICFSEVSQIDPDLIRADYPAEGYPPLLDMDPLKRLYDLQEQLEELNG